MNQLLQSFRGQIFEASFLLFKKTLVYNLLTSVLVSLISLSIAIPLILQALGWSFDDIINFQANLQEVLQNQDAQEAPFEAIMSLFGNINIPLIILTVIIILFLNVWSYVAFFKINENVIFNKSLSLMDIYKQVKLSLVTKTIGLYFLLNFFIIASMGLFFGIIFIISSISGILAGIVGFIGFFILLILLVRFTLVLPATIHDELGLSESFGFSFQKLTFKRAGLLFLIGIVFVIATSMISGLFSLIFNAAFSNQLTIAFIVNQIFSLIIGGIISAYIFSALSAVYYRYTEHGIDKNNEENFDAHVIDNN